jgi:hypothetical protein
MQSRLSEILSNGEANNGVRALLEEVRKRLPDMPPEYRDDMVFGVLVVIYDECMSRGRKRNKRITRLEVGNILTGMALMVIVLTILAIHGDIPWLSALLTFISS